MKTEIPTYSASIRLSIKSDNTSLLMQVLKDQSSDNLIKEAILFAIACNKPETLKTILSTYPNYANFTFYNKDGKIAFAGYSNHTCPLFYAVNSKKWDCAIVLANTINNHKLGHAYFQTHFSQDNYKHLQSNDCVFLSAIQNKQYTLCTIMLESGVQINKFDFMDIATKAKDSQLIQIGFKYNAHYNTNLSSNELFASEWQLHQKALEKQKEERQQQKEEEQQRKRDEEKSLREEVQRKREEQAKKEEEQRIPLLRIADLEHFLKEYNSVIAITALFYPVLNMSELVKDIKTILTSEAFSLDEKITKADKVILNYLQNSASVAINQNNWDDFDWQTKVLGLDEVKTGLFTKTRFNVLTLEHINYIESVKKPELKKSEKEDKINLASQHFFASKPVPYTPPNNTNDAAIADDIPLYYKCPISHEIMDNPTLCTLDGNTYEDSCIRASLAKNPWAPLNPGAVMKEGQTINDVLCINRNLKDAIEAFKANKANSINKMKGL